MRRVLVAAFCASLLMFMLLPTPITVDPYLDDVEILNSSGRTASVDSLAWEWGEKTGGSSVDDMSNAVAVDSSGDVYVTGSFESIANFGSTTLSSSGSDDIFVAKMNNTGSWQWAVSAGGTGKDVGIDLSVDSSGNVYLTGTFRGTALFGSDSMTSGPNTNDDFFVAKLDTWGNWQWVEGVTCHNNGRCTGAAIDTDSSGYSYVTGAFIRDIDVGTTTLQWEGVEDIFVAKIDTHGSWQWAQMAGGAQGGEISEDLAIGPNGIFITGHFELPTSFGSQTITSTAGVDVFVAKISPQGDWLWAEVVGGTSTDVAFTITVNSQGQVYIAGEFYSEITFGNITVSGSGVRNSFIAKGIDTGNSISWSWGQRIVSSTTNSNSVSSLALDSNGDLYAAGYYKGSAMFGSQVLTSIGSRDVFVAKLSANGVWSWVKGAGSAGDDYALDIQFDTQDNLFVVGHFLQGTISLTYSTLRNGGGLDGFIAKMSSDYDLDLIPDSLDTDADGDFVLDLFDACVPSPLGFQSESSTDHDGDGCQDIDEDIDDDGDGAADVDDSCPRGAIGWTQNSTTDIDMDGCLDQIEDYDDDGDQFDDYLDFCPQIFGNSTFEFEQGCPDKDGDGRPDIKDPFDEDPTEWLDSDLDGIGDNSDAFPNDPTQIIDTDSDGYGDYPFGNFPDGCPDEFGTSISDQYGCVDSDGDNVSDLNDKFPNDPDWWKDTDDDGVHDEADDFPYNPAQWSDSDGDGYGDNPMDASADRFVDDNTQWSDVDGDGYGDNPNGNSSDAFPLDPTQWLDTDGDGFGDNPNGNSPDAFPQDSTQWIDADDDGLGDNQSGNNPDPYLSDTDNDGYANSVDPLPLYSTPGDQDGDNCPDLEDVFPTNSKECKDTDGDMIGDNEDPDDDGDGWDDWTEMRLGTEPLDPYDYPIENDYFELRITDNIALSAWDLMGVLTATPLASWLIFGFVTRNNRTELFEQRMRSAKTREDLELVATEYERALMIRLIGPHQGIRLERVRAELDDEIEMGDAKLAGEEDDLGPVVTTPDQTDYTEDEMGMGPPEDATVVDDGNGHEWVKDGKNRWYRPVGESVWIKYDPNQ